VYAGRKRAFQGRTGPLPSWQDDRLTFTCDGLSSLSAVFAVSTFPVPLFWIWTFVRSFQAIEKVEPIPWSECAKLAIDERVDLSARLFQASLIVLGAVWGLIVVKPSDARLVLKDPPERCLLLLATIALVGSLYAHVALVESMSHYALMASATRRIPDLDHPDVSYSLLAQYLAILGGGLVAALVVVSAKWIRGDHR
jgi:hypothetical protein